MFHIFLTLGKTALTLWNLWEFTGKADTCAIETILTHDSLRSKCHVTGVTAVMHFTLHVHLFDCVYSFIRKTPRNILPSEGRWFFRVYGGPNSTLTTSDLLRRLKLLEVVRALLNEFHCLVINTEMAIICNNVNSWMYTLGFSYNPFPLWGSSPIGYMKLADWRGWILGGSGGFKGMI